MNSDPMTEERLTEIRQFLSWNPPFSEPQSVPELAMNYLVSALAEIDRLREQNMLAVQDASATRNELAALAADNERLQAENASTQAALHAEELRVMRLLGKLGRERDKVAAMREMVAAVADTRMTQAFAERDLSTLTLLGHGTALALVQQARALLGEARDE